MPVMLSDAVALLVSVIVWAGLLVPMVCDANAKLLGATVTVGGAVVPVPVRAIVCGLPLMLSAIETEAARAPVAVGVNIAEIVQLAPAARLEPHVFV